MLNRLHRTEAVGVPPHSTSGGRLPKCTSGGVQSSTRAGNPGDVAGAVAAYKAAIASGDVDHASEAAINLGHLLRQRGDAPGALAAYQQAIAIGHANAASEAAFNLGILLEEQEDVAGARAAYEQAIASGYTNIAPKAAENLGNLLRALGDMKGAQVAYQQFDWPQANSDSFE